MAYAIYVYILSLACLRLFDHGLFFLSTGLSSKMVRLLKVEFQRLIEY